MGVTGAFPCRRRRRASQLIVGSIAGGGRHGFVDLQRCGLVDMGAGAWAPVWALCSFPLVLRIACEGYAIFRRLHRCLLCTLHAHTDAKPNRSGRGFGASSSISQGFYSLMRVGQRDEWLASLDGCLWQARRAARGGEVRLSINKCCTTSLPNCRRCLSDTVDKCSHHENCNARKERGRRKKEEESRKGGRPRGPLALLSSESKGRREGRGV